MQHITTYEAGNHSPDYEIPDILYKKDSLSSSEYYSTGP
jgi:hypothetical protein